VHACLREHRRELSDACRREEMILEQQEAEHIELRPNLLKACADERQAFCAVVAPGSARVFRCVGCRLRLAAACGLVAGSRCVACVM
jgi:Golgi apparatus protein 1